VNKLVAIVAALSAVIMIAAVALIFRSRPTPTIESRELDRLKSAVIARRRLGIELETTKDGSLSATVYGGAAARAGISSGDVILKINGKDVDERTLWSAVPAGGTIEITVRDPRRTRTLPVVITTPASHPDDVLRFRAECVAARRLGADLDHIWFSDIDRRKLGIATPTGVKLLTWNRGPAARSGAQGGDICVAVDGRDVSERNFADVLLACGKTAKLGVVRGDQKLDLVVTLDDFQPFDAEFAELRAALVARRWFGAHLEGLVLEPKQGSPAEASGMKPGDVIESIGGRPVTVESFADEVSSIRLGDKADVVVRRGSERVTLGVVFSEFTVAQERLAELTGMLEFHLGVELDPDGPALKVNEVSRKTGLQKGDVFAKPSTKRALAELLASGGRDVVVYRDQKETPIVLQLGELRTFVEKAVEAVGAEAAKLYLGAHVQELKVTAPRFANPFGMKTGDVLLKLDGNDITASSLADLLSARKCGEQAELVVLRGGERTTLKGTLGDRATADAELAEFVARANAGLDFRIAWPPASIEASPTMFIYHGGPARRAGMRSGDRLVEISSVRDVFAKPATGTATFRTRRGAFAVTPGVMQTSAEELEQLRRDGCLRLALGIRLDEGLRVRDCVLGGPSESAGLDEGDEIVRIGSSQVTEATLVEALKGLRRGMPVEIEYRRGSETRTTTVTPDALVILVKDFDAFCTEVAK